MVLNSIWSLQKRVGFPRLAAIEFPIGRPLGDAGQHDLHRRILEDTLRVFETAREPGWVEPLPYRWHEPPEKTTWLPDPPPPFLQVLRERMATGKKLSLRDIRDE